MNCMNDLRRVTVVGRSWESHTQGVYCFEATVDGVPVELEVGEEVAFDFLQAWTPSAAKCLEILRLHRADLAQALELKIRHGRTVGDQRWSLTWRDMHAVARASSRLVVVAA